MSFNTLCVRLEDAHHSPADLGCVCLCHGSLTFELRQALTDVFSSWNPTLEKDNPQRLTALLTDSLPDLWGRKVANELLKARARKDEVRPAPVDDALLLGLVCDSDRMGALRFATSAIPCIFSENAALLTPKLRIWPNSAKPLAVLNRETFCLPLPWNALRKMRQLWAALAPKQVLPTKTGDSVWPSSPASTTIATRRLGICNGPSGTKSRNPSAGISAHRHQRSPRPHLCLQAL